MKVLVFLSLAVILTGCATTSQQVVATTPLPSPHAPGTYHTVLKGETLWRIAKSYNADINDVIEANRMSDPSKIDAGQKIFIPGVKKTVKVMPATAAGKKSKKGYIWPVRGRVVSYYGSKSDRVKNKGIDIATNPGDIIVASRSGKVVFCDDKVKGLGKTIIIDHGDRYSTVYAHNSEHLVSVGDYVNQNQAIAKAGDTGRSKGTTLHFQVRRGHEPKNPFYYLP